MGSPTTWLAVALGGALGSLTRFGRGNIRSDRPALSLGTLLINVVGSLMAFYLGGSGAGWLLGRL